MKNNSFLLVLKMDRLRFRGCLLLFSILPEIKSLIAKIVN